MSNALSFTVPAADGSSLTLAPDLLTLVVGDTAPIQALDSNAQPVTGLTWASSDTSVVSLSTDDPPILTAVAAGHATITAGSASADVTVSSATLPVGSVLWSNAGGASGVKSIVPAVPSLSGVADVFALQNDKTVQAITSDGLTAWTASVSQADGWVVPDFQGGAVVVSGQGTPNALRKLDGTTGQPYPAYTVGNNSYLASVGVHPDGTIFALIAGSSPSFVGIDPTTGAEKFNIPMPSLLQNWDNMIVAGDGYAYLPYVYRDSLINLSTHFKVLRVDSNGAYSMIDVYDWTDLNYFSFPFDHSEISNAGDGILLSWWWNGGDEPVAHLTKVSSAGVSDANGPIIPGQAQAPVSLVLQREDGSFLGTAMIGDKWATLDNLTPYMIALDATGNVLWSVPNEQPEIATADNGAIGRSGITYDQSGNATGQGVLNATVVPGWLGNVLGTAYSKESGMLTSYAGPNTNYASTFYAFEGGNASGSGTAIQQVMAKSPKTGSKQLPDLSSPACPLTPVEVLGVFIPPTCGNINAIELLTSASPDSIFQDIIQKFAPVTADASPKNSVMTFTGPNDSSTINVSAPGQILSINLAGWAGGAILDAIGENPFSVMTERVDPVAHVISVVTLAGHPLAGWRYWRVYSIGTNDVVIETGAYDQPNSEPGNYVESLNYAGYYISKPILQYGWRQYMQYIQLRLQSPQGSHLKSALGGIQLRSFPPFNGPLVDGYWDYYGDFTNYILNDVCQSTVCN